MPNELDAVELTRPVAGWPPGTTGTVVDVPTAGVVTVEIADALLDPDAPLLDALIDAPTSSVRVTARHAQPA